MSKAGYETETVTIQLPKKIYDTLKDLAKLNNFNTVEEEITYSIIDHVRAELEARALFYEVEGEGKTH